MTADFRETIERWGLEGAWVTTKHCIEGTGWEAVDNLVQESWLLKVLPAAHIRERGGGHFFRTPWDGVSVRDLLWVGFWKWASEVYRLSTISRGEVRDFGFSAVETDLVNSGDKHLPPLLELSKAEFEAELALLALELSTS